MSHWNYRMVRRSQRSGVKAIIRYEVSEVYNSLDGRPFACSKQPGVASGVSVEELRETLVRMLAATYAPIFRVSELDVTAGPAAGQEMNREK